MTARGMMYFAAAVLLAACTFTVTPEPDRVATRVAEDLAVAQTLTAVARPAVLPTVPVARVTPTVVPIRPTTAPIATPLPVLADPVVPAFGSTNGLTGEVVLPGYTGALDSIVFTDRIVFRLKVFDPDAGATDGANIQSVAITIDSPRGETAHAQTEVTSWYCAFGGGAPACPVWVFAEHDNRWPNGTPVCAGQGYQANMIVTTANGNRTDASWRFNFGIEGDAYPPCF
ncbi:MAG: hypothetical protein HY870_16000 [Chloroflexi bacterium]|nr:hypothetical protein [Chloroflexota bacterium]